MGIIFIFDNFFTKKTNLEEIGIYMAHHKSAFKRIRTSEKARIYNRQHKSAMRKAIKSVVTAADKETAMNTLKQTSSILDKLVLKGIIHKNKASNQKSRLTKFVNKLS